MNTQEIFNALSNALAQTANAAASSYHYNTWSDTFCREETKETFERCKHTIPAEDFRFFMEQLSPEGLARLRLLGFHPWSELEDGKQLILFPLWSVSVIEPSLEVISIDGSFTTLGKADTDTRYGLIAYGLNVQVAG